MSVQKIREIGENFFLSFWLDISNPNIHVPPHFVPSSFACPGPGPPTSRRGNEITTIRRRHVSSLQRYRRAGGQGMGEGQMGRVLRSKDVQVMRIDGICRERWQLWCVSVIQQLPTATDHLTRSNMKSCLAVESVYQVGLQAAACVIKRRAHVHASSLLTKPITFAIHHG